MYGPRLLTLAPWRRGPALLLRRPGVAVALGAAAFVAVLPAASAPLFLSASRSAALHHQMDNTCAAKVAEHIEAMVNLRDDPFDQNVAHRTSAQARAAYASRRATVDQIATGIPGLTPPVSTVLGVTAVRGATRTLAEPDDDQVWLVGRSDAFGEHLQVREGPSGAGIWLPDRFAEEQGLHVGDVLNPARLQLRPSFNGVPVDPDAEPTPLRVAAIYTDLRSLPDRPYWCTLRDTYRGFPGQEFSDVPILPVMFADLDTVARVAAASRQSYITEYVDLELTNPKPTNQQAHGMAGRIAALRDALDRSTATRSVYGRPAYISALGTNADRADLVYRTLLGTVIPTALAGTLVGLVVVAAAAVFWVQRRRVELAVLATHGVGPGALGVKAMTEAVAALVLGALAGVATAWVLVVTVGPSRVLSGEAEPGAAGAAAAAVLTCVAVTGVVAALRVRPLADEVRRRRRVRLLALPWELVLLAGSPLLWRWAGGAAVRSDQPGGLGAVAQVPDQLVVVPIVVFIATVILGARLGARWLRRQANRPGPRRPAPFLAWRRLGRPAVVGTVLAAAAAVPVALAGFGATVTDSVRLTLHAKAELVVGADTVVTLDRPVPVPAELAGRSTEVLRLDRIRVDGYQVDVVGIDPATFGRGAYWHRQLAGGSLADQVADLRPGPDANGLAYGVLPAGRHTIQFYGEPEVPVDVRAAPLLPSAEGGYPLLLVHRDVLGSLTRYAVPQLWVSGDEASAAAAVERARLPVNRIRHPGDVLSDSLYEPVTYTFQYLVALAAFAGLVVVVGLLLYLEARAPAHRRGYVLLRRMGLRARTHLLALYLEIAAPLLAGLATGLALAAGMVWVGRGRFDLAPGIPPGPLVAVPGGLALALAAAAALVSVGSALFAQRRVGRANPAQVLRDTA
jgi:putative ABC transport system permease protein